MVERGEHGKLKSGSVLNPKGRPKRTEEEQFNAVLLSVVTPDRFRAALEKQQHKAEMGDLESFKYICKLLGLEVDKKQLSGELKAIIEYVNTPYPTSSLSSSTSGDKQETEEV
jgi:hypothetical protein